MRWSHQFRTHRCCFKARSDRQSGLVYEALCPISTLKSVFVASSRKFSEGVSLRDRVLVAALPEPREAPESPPMRVTPPHARPASRKTASQQASWLRTSSSRGQGRRPAGFWLPPRRRRRGAPKKAAKAASQPLTLLPYPRREQGLLTQPFTRIEGQAGRRGPNFSLHVISKKAYFRDELDR